MRRVATGSCLPGIRQTWQGRIEIISNNFLSGPTNRRLRFEYYLIILNIANPAIFLIIFINKTDLYYVIILTHVFIILIYFLISILFNFNI